MFSPCHCPRHPTREWKQRQSDCLTQPSEMSQMTSESEPEKREQNGERKSQEKHGRSLEEEPEEREESRESTGKCEREEIIE